jgi:ABC-2 type transport system ATP-binding protein
VLTAARVTRRFGERVAVEDLSLELVPGEIFGLLGPNGGGKTTTLRMLAGLIAPSTGSVMLDGEPVNRETSARLRRRIGFLTETPGLWDQFTVRQNLLVYARLYGIARPSAAVDETMEMFAVRDRASDPAATLSKGLRQRVALARAMLHKPDIILLDEPTSGLDPESARDVRLLIERARADHRSVVLSTHNLDEVERMADRVAVLRQRLLAVDTPSALRHRLFGSRIRLLLSQPAAPFTSALGSSGITAEGSTLWVDLSSAATTTPELVRRLVAAGADIQQVVPDEPPLEDIYLQLVRNESRNDTAS